MRRRFLPLALVLLLVSVTVSAVERRPITPPTAEFLRSSVAMLAHPQMAGRGPGTTGGEQAAHEIARLLGDAGLQPAGDAQTFFQSFVFATGTRVASNSQFDVLAPDAKNLDADRDWRPHGGSRQGEVANDVVFVGYGITATDGRWDDYRGVDVRGRIALALDGAPADVGARVTSRLDKLIAARRAGAGALLIASERLPTVEDTAAHVDLVSAGVTRAAADRLLAPSGDTAERLEAMIATRRAPASFIVPGRRARVRVALEPQPRRTSNVIAVLPGHDPALAHEAVVIGAHYDHLGVIGGQIHPGADDNASGTATVLGLARAFAAAGGTPRTLVFVFFGAEELGLLGSTHYVQHPVVPIARTVAMVNLDMVGRLGGNALTVGGVDSGIGLRALVNDAAAATGVRVNAQASPHTPSDHQSFYRAGTPVLFFHTGGHADYHKPTDTADRIDADGMARVATMAGAVIERVAALPASSYVKIAPPPAGRQRAGRERTAPAGSAFLGISADGRTHGDGVHLRQVIPGSAAERAGLQQGDVLVRMFGETVNGFDDLRRLIEAKKPGDAVELVFLRNGEDRTASAALGARP